jgi:hypothetical protein
VVYQKLGLKPPSFYSCFLSVTAFTLGLISPMSFEFCTGHLNSLDIILTVSISRSSFLNQREAVVKENVFPETM